MLSRPTIRAGRRELESGGAADRGGRPDTPSGGGAAWHRVHVGHFPPGTSKWNKIAHRLFCHVTQNWRGKPLGIFETVVDLIGNTRTAAGLSVATYPRDSRARRMDDRSRKPLQGTPLHARRQQAAKGPAKLVDAHGLYLRVSPRGARSWIQRLTIQGLRTDNSIGHYPSMGLAEARAVAFERWKIAKGGGDPRVPESRAPAPTFAEAAEAVIAMHYAHPSIGELPVSQITPGHVMAVLTPIWNEKRETARRVKQRISAICRWAVAQGRRTDDPAGIVIDAALPRNGVERRHMPALPYEEAADCIAKVQASRRAGTSSKLALEFLILTAARSSEVRKATWDDTDAAVWTVPAGRMKANREHRVPLSGRALEVLAEAAGLSDGSGLVFPGTRPGRPLSENTHAKLLRELGFHAVTRGFRSSFRDWASERTHTPHAVMEAALAHAIRNKAEAAYARSDLFEKRRALMEAWATYLRTVEEQPLRSH